MILAVWEKHDDRADIVCKLADANASEIAGLQIKLAALPKQGSSGIIGRWISAKIRGKRSKGKIVEFAGSKQFKLEFEQFKQGQSDPDDGDYDLLGGDDDWCFTDALAQARTNADNLVERVARRNRQ